MTKLQEECLLSITCAAIGTPDNYVVAVELPVRTSIERDEICRFLENEGYIGGVELLGRAYVRCTVQEKALLYTINYYQKGEEK